MTVEVVFPSGAIRVSDIVDDHLVSIQYFGYTQAEAVRIFEAEEVSKS